MSTCPRCAASLPDGVSFCSACGSTITAPPVTPPPQPYAPVQPGAYIGPQENSGKAIGSLVCGLLFFIPFSFIVAIVLGHIALSEIKRSAGRLKGQGMAIAGLVLGYGTIVFVPILLIIAAIAIPNLLRARMAANEASAVGALRTYSTAMITYASQCPNVGFPASVQDLGPGNGDCNGANLVNTVFATPAMERSGYRFFYSPGPTDPGSHVVTYTITADPVTENTTGSRHFFVDESGVIRYARDMPATSASPPLE